MSTTTTTPVATTTPAAEENPNRRPLSILGGISLALAPLLIVGGNLTCPPQASNSPADYITSLAQDPFLTNTSASLYHYGWIAFAFGLLAAIGLVRGRKGSRLALVGGLAGAFGAIQLSGLLMSDWFNGAMGRLLPIESAAAVFTDVMASPSLAVWMNTAKVGAILLPLVLFAGLARAGVISWWLVPVALSPMILGPLLAGLLGGGVLAVVVSTVVSLAGFAPCFLTAVRLINRGRLAAS